MHRKRGVDHLTYHECMHESRMQVKQDASKIRQRKSIKKTYLRVPRASGIRKTADALVPRFA